MLPELLQIKYNLYLKRHASELVIYGFIFILLKEMIADIKYELPKISEYEKKS